MKKKKDILEWLLGGYITIGVTVLVVLLILIIKGLFA
jgi:hypothetical protein